MPNFVTMVDTLSAPRGVPALSAFSPQSDAPPAGLAPSSVADAILRGARSRCPSCGCSRLFRTFLKPIAVCPACGEDWQRRTADDFPPYLVILVLGHVIGPSMIATETLLHPPLWLHLVIWPPLVLVLALMLIQPMKGAVMAAQWWLWDREAADEAAAAKEVPVGEENSSVT